MSLFAKLKNQPEPRVIGIDPGDAESAYCILQPGHPIETATIPNAALLLQLIGWSCYCPEDTTVVIEHCVGYGMSVGQSTLDTCVMIGRIIERCVELGLSWHLLSRKEIKHSLCGNITSKDKDVREALIHRYGEPGSKKLPGSTYGISGDAWSALAIATTYKDNQLKYKADGFGFPTHVHR